MPSVDEWAEVELPRTLRTAGVAIAKKARQRSVLGKSRLGGKPSEHYLTIAV